MKFFTLFTLILITMFVSQCGKKYNLSDGLYAVIETDKGDIIIRLEYEKAPLTVMNFVGLAEGTLKNTFRKKGEPFYDGLTFHRVEPGFVIQGGDPKGNGSGGPGYVFPNEIHPDLRHDSEGTVAMANAGPNTNGSQFYITLAPTPHLDGHYNVFGKVVQGMEVVKSIQKGDVMKHVKILRIGEKASQFKATQEKFDSLRTALNKKLEEMAIQQKKQAIEFIRKKWPDLQKSPEGIFYKILKKGKGPKPAKGQIVVAHYRGKFLDGRVFDESYKRGQPFSFPLGEGKVIKGWEITLSQMHKGEKRMVILPPELAYGSRGAGGVIPPNAFLVFEIELIDIKNNN